MPFSWSIKQKFNMKRYAAYVNGTKYVRIHGEHIYLKNEKGISRLMYIRDILGIIFIFHIIFSYKNAYFLGSAQGKTLTPFPRTYPTSLRSNNVYYIFVRVSFFLMESGLSELIGLDIKIK